MAFRFVHAADIHLDSPLRSLALRDSELAELIGGATRRALVKIVDLSIEERVDALLIAGDLYDGDQTSMKTARFLAEQLGRLDQAGVRAFIIRGNHDAMSRITKELVLPESVKVFGGRAEAIELSASGLSVAVHGLSFAQAHAPESLLTKYRKPLEGCVNIGLMHTSLGGAPGHDRYAPCAAADLHASEFDYWALGHIHRRFVEQDRTTIVMPGIPQGRDIGESGAKSVTLATVRDDRSIVIEERSTSIAEFQPVALDLTGAADWREAARRIEAALAEARAACRSECLVARLELGGATPLAWRLRADADQVLAQAQEAGRRLGKVWIDKIEIDCAAPKARANAGHGDPIGELRALMESHVIDSRAFLEEMAECAEDLRKALPANSREALFGADAEAFASALKRIAREGAEDVLAHLRATDKGGA